MNYQSFIPLYDFTLIEQAVQAFFVAVDGGSFVAPPNDTDKTREKWKAGDDNIAFYTAFQSLTFTKCRPRVYVSLHQINPVKMAYAIDANGTTREKAWRGQARIGIISKPDYTVHTQLRASVLAIIPQLMAAISDDNSQFPLTGLNSILQYHEVSEFWTRDVSTAIVPEDGNYNSMIPVEVAFNIKTSAWPAGMITY